MPKDDVDDVLDELAVMEQEGINGNSVTIMPFALPPEGDAPPRRLMSDLPPLDPLENVEWKCETCCHLMKQKIACGDMEPKPDGTLFKRIDRYCLKAIPVLRLDEDTPVIECSTYWPKEGK